MDWQPFSPKSVDVIKHANARLVILHGAVRSAKTITCTVKWLEYLATGPQGDLVMLGRTRDTLQRNVLNTIRDTVGESNFKWANKQSGELILLGRRVYCLGASNEDAESKLRGATFAGALCDEVNLYPENVFNQLMARLSVKGAQCFCNCNPDNPSHWFYVKYMTNPTITNKQIWKFFMEDNPALDPAYIADLKSEYSSSKVWYERMVLGNWVAAEGLIYDMFDPEKHVKRDVLKSVSVNPNTITWVAACDYGTSSVMSWGLYAILPKGTILKVKEFYYDAKKERRQKTDTEFGRDFQAWLGGLDPWMVYCDPSASSWKAELRQRGYRVRDANNDVINGIRLVGSALSRFEYLIDASCVNTIKEYQNYSWDDKASLMGQDKPIKENDHAVDTDRYCIASTIGNKLSGGYSVR